MRMLPRQTSLAAAALVLVSTALALGAPTNSPSRVAFPESSSNCPVPSLVQCQDATWLETDRCGILQRENQWTCSTLLMQGMSAKKASDGEVLSTVPQSLDSVGVAKVVKAAPEAVKATYVPDLYSFTSQQAARDYGAVDVLGVNKYDAFTANKNVVESCEEYAFEKFFDISEFTRRVGGARGDQLAAYLIAFGSGNDAASIGTRHLSSPQLRGRDGRTFGSMLEGTRPKNAFFAVPYAPALKGQAPVQGAPSLVTALLKTPAAAYLGKVWGQPGQVDNKWSAHKAYADELLYVPTTAPQKTLALPPQQDDPGGLKAIMGQTEGAKPKRKRLAKELDELYDLQQRFRATFDAWARLNEHFAGSGWSTDALKPNEPSMPSGKLGALQAGGLGGKVDKLATPNGPAGAKKPGVVNDIASEPVETVQRKKVLSEMLDLMQEADAEGCFDTGRTPCDWSPKLFATAVRNTFSNQQDAAFALCNEFSKGSVQNLKNLDKKFVDDKAYPQFACGVKTGPSVTAKNVDDLVAKVAECNEKVAAYQKQKAADEEAKRVAEAKARIAAVPELVDKSGVFQKPGISKSRDELMGGDKFGMGYSYDFGWIFDAKTEICKLQLEAHGAFSTYANVFGIRYDIIDTLASFSTETRKLNLHAKVAGKNLFTPVDRAWGKGESSFDFSLVKNIGSKKKSIPIFKTWIVVVIIPVKIEAGISGEAGLDLGLDGNLQGFDNEQCPKASIGGLAEPYVSVDGYLEAGIDVFVASVGIRGSLTIVRASLPFRAGVGVQVLKGDLNPSNYELFADTRMSLKVTTLSGNISVYGQVGWCPFCVRGEKEIVSFEGPSLDHTLFDQKYKVNLADLGVALGIK